jgi:hypothetical protein
MPKNEPRLTPIQKYSQSARQGFPNQTPSRFEDSRIVSKKMEAEFAVRAYFNGGLTMKQGKNIVKQARFKDA